MLCPRILLVGLVALACPKDAYANQSFDTEFGLAQSFDNNYGLNEQSRKSVAVTRAKVQQGYRYDAERLDINAEAELAYRHYETDDSGLKDGESFELAFDGAFLATERQSVAWDVSTLTNQTTGDEYEEFLGFIGVRERNVDKRKIIHSADLSYSGRVSERFDVGATLLLVDNRYLDAETTQLIDYEYRVSQIKLNGLVSENWSVFVTAEYSGFEPKPSSALLQKLNAVESQSISALIGGAFQLSEKFRLSAAVGQRQSEYKSEFRADEKDKGRQIVIDASYQAEFSKTTVTISEQVEPGTNGSARLVRRFDTLITSPLSETLRGRFGLAYESEEREFALAGSGSEALVESSASLEKSVSEKQRLGIKARYRRLLEGSDPESIRVELFWRYQI